jgi:hypothetical protein
MHRLCAIVLLSAMVFWVDAPALTGTSQDAIPACCRAHGKHKCMMRMAANQPIHGIAPKCPFVPRFSFTAVNGPGIAIPIAAQSRCGALAAHPAAQAQAETLFRISFARSRQKRGPPVFLL